MLSIVIPTLNEKDHLPLLLNSIKSQSPSLDYEIVVADAGSQDETCQIARDFGCRVVKGGFPATGKNLGAAEVRGETILFVDADVILSEDFLEKNLKEFEERSLVVASFYLRSENKTYNFLFNLLYNLPTRLTEGFLPQAMNIILVKKDVHQKINGFGPEVKLGEELDYIRRARKFGKFGVLKAVKALASARRYVQDGWLITWSKYFFCQIHMIFLGPVKTDMFRYKFNHYSTNKQDEVK